MEKCSWHYILLWRIYSPFDTRDDGMLNNFFSLLKYHPLLRHFLTAIIAFGPSLFWCIKYRGRKSALSILKTVYFIWTAISRSSSTVATLLMCVAANPTPMAFRPLKTCWPTSCWGSLCGWSLPPLVSATSSLSACVHTSDRRINSTPCALSPSAVSHSTIKLILGLICAPFYHFEFNLCSLAWLKPMWCRLDLEGLSSARAQTAQRQKLPWKCGAVSVRFSSDSSQVAVPYELHLWLCLIDIQYSPSSPQKWTRITKGMECGKVLKNEEN